MSDIFEEKEPQTFGELIYSNLAVPFEELRGRLNKVTPESPEEQVLLDWANSYIYDEKNARFVLAQADTETKGPRSQKPELICLEFHEVDALMSAMKKFLHERSIATE